MDNDTALGTANSTALETANGTAFETANDTFSSSNLKSLATAHAAWIMVPITVTTLVANVLLIIVYARFRRLQTPFAVYIVSLATGDLAQTLTLHIRSIFTLLGVTWPLGQRFCTFILYTCWAFLSFSYHIHVLICANRLWAVVFPTHYRLFHSRKVAVMLVIATLAYIHLWTLPGFVIHIMHYSSADGVPMCIPSYPHELAWSNPTYVALFLVPEMLVLMMYPVILIKVRGKVRNRVRNDPGNRGISTQRKSLNAVPSLRFSQQNQSSPGNSRPETKRPHNPRPHFAVLTGLVMVAVVCWTPVNTAYTLVYFRGLLLYSVMTPCTVIFFLDALLNPIIFLLGSRDWRKALKKLFGY